MTFKPAQTKST